MPKVVKWLSLNSFEQLSKLFFAFTRKRTPEVIRTHQTSFFVFEESR